MSTGGGDDPVWQHALHWAIASPPLLAASQLPTAQSFSAVEFHQLWQRWPVGLATEPESIGHGRLGRQFEALWQYWLRGNPDWQLCAANLPVRDWARVAASDEHKPVGRVLGELDLLVHSVTDNITEHWELAVKFYLGVGDTRQPQHWLGPNLTDTLASKMRRLQHQLAITETPAGLATLAAAGVVVSAHRAIVKGRLYYPLFNREEPPAAADSAHLRGVWATATEWRQWLQHHVQSRPLSARLFPRRDWLSGQSRGSVWQPFIPTPVSELLSLELDNGWAILVMPDDWPSRAELAIRNTQVG